MLPETIHNIPGSARVAARTGLRFHESVRASLEDQKQRALTISSPISGLKTPVVRPMRSSFSSWIWVTNQRPTVSSVGRRSVAYGQVYMFGQGDCGQVRFAAMRSSD